MPQLDVTTFIPQLFWLAVSFLVLYLLMRLVALPRVGAAIDSRRARLDQDLARAAETRTQAQAVQSAYEAKLAEARAQGQDAIRQTAERAAAEAAQRHRQLADALAEQIRGAERQIAAAKDQAISEIPGVAVEIARSLAEKLAGAPADEPTLAAAVERAMAERTG
jgi:F-type H+-transporting ATPase subunit b